MKYSKPLQRVKLLRRYKRFLADVQWPDGSEMTVHTANTGAMLGCAIPGNHIWIRDSENDRRKYRYSWEISAGEGQTLIGVNTGLANALVAEGIQAGVVSELTGYSLIRREVPYAGGSRIDLLLQQAGRSDCYVEVKNVTARAGDQAIFPDAVTARGTKHLQALTEMVRAGQRAVIFFCVQRSDVDSFRPAREIDPTYAETLHHALDNGVEALAYGVSISPREITLCRAIPVKID